MRTHTGEYKNALIGVRETDHILRTYNNGWSVYDNDNLIMAKPILNANLFKTVMKELDIETKTKIEVGTMIDYKHGLKVGDDFEYLNYGRYYVYEAEYRPDTKSYHHICYDNMLNAMVKYEPLSITYPITVKDYITAIAGACGLIGHTPYYDSNFVNQNKMITQDYFNEGEFTYRDILDYLCEVIGGWLYIDNNNDLKIKYPTETRETFNEDYLNYINISFEKKYGPVNSVVLARANELDNIEYKDDESIAQNGLCRVKFSDNPFLSDENRSEYLQQLGEKIIGLEFYLNDLESKGITYLELGDIYSFKISETMMQALKSGLVKSGMRKAQGDGSVKYKCLMLNDEQELGKGIVERIYTDEPEEDNTQYIVTNPSENSLKNAEILVNKNASEIVLKANSDGQVVQARLDADADNGSLFEVKADNIKLEGYTTINDGFGVDLNGNMFANGGTFGGTINTSQDCTVGNDLYVGQNQTTTSLDEKYIYFNENAKIKRTSLNNSNVISIYGDFVNQYATNGAFTQTGPTSFSAQTQDGKGLLSVSSGNSYLVGGNSTVTLLNNYAQLSSGTGSTSNYIQITPSAINLTRQPTIISDKRLKKNIKNIDVNWIDELKVKEFEYKNSDDKQVGLIAQDYLDKDYSKYFLNEDDEGYYSIAYGNITNALIQYCQEMKKEINSLKEEIKQLKECDK